MALSDKNIVITPNKGQSSDPKIVFSGASSTLGPQNITLQVYPTNNGTLSFEGSAGQLLSVANTLTGTIFSVNDVSGTPSIEVLDTGVIRLAQYAGNVGIGTDNPSRKLHVRDGSSGATPDTSFSQQMIESSGDAGIYIANPNANIGRIMFGAPARQIGALIRWENTNNNFDFSTDKTGGYIRFLTDTFVERVRITSAGNVGIGTTNPGKKLTISRATETTSEQLELRNEGGISTGNYDGIVWTQGSTGATALASIRANYNSTGAPDMAFNLRNDANVLFLRAGGNVGIGTTSPSGKLHITSSGITAAAPSLGWPVYNAEADANSRSIYIDTAGNGSVSTAGQGATVTLQLGQYYDSRVVITPPGSGGASPSDQGAGRGKDMMIKAGTSDNGVGFSGGRLYLSGGMGFTAGGYNGNVGNVLIQPFGGNVGMGTTQPQSPLDVITPINGYASFGAGLSVGNWSGIHFGYRENNTAYRKSAIVFERTDAGGGGGNAAGKVHILNGPATGSGSATLSDARLTIDEIGDVGIGTTTPGNLLDVAGTAAATGLLSRQGRLNSSRYPLGHYSSGETVFEIDPTWTTEQLRAYFNSNSVSWVADSTAPAGYAIQITGVVNVAAGIYGSGFPYIPVETDDIFYMEVYIRDVTGTNGHYMGSVDFNHNFSSLGGNPGSFGYWVMTNSFPGTSWTKYSGYIGGFGTSTGQFVSGTEYWTPQALFNYTGAGTSYISGWKVTKVNCRGRKIIQATGFSGASSGTYQFQIQNSALASSSPDLTFGADGTFGYIQSWNSKPLLINNQGNYIQTGGDLRAPTFSDSGNTGFYIDPANSGTAGNFNGTVNAVVFNTTSDLRLKENIAPITDAVDKVKRINGITYNFKNDEKKTRHAGVVAQDVLEVLPEAVAGSEQDQYRVSYADLVGLLVEAVKELKSEIEELKKGRKDGTIG